MIKEVTISVFQTDDNCRFETRQGAILHEQKIALNKVYEEWCCGDQDRDSDAVDFILARSVSIKNILNGDV